MYKFHTLLELNSCHYLLHTFKNDYIHLKNDYIHLKNDYIHLKMVPVKLSSFASK